MPSTESLLSTAEVLRVLNIPGYRLEYLFKSRRLKPEEFATLKGTGHRVYRHDDLAKIKRALFEVSAK